MKEKDALRLLLEMMKNSRRSDRDLAKVLHVSQPTVTRTRQRLEKDYIQTYTLVPRFDKIGYEILAFTFCKSKTYEKATTDKMINHAREWYLKHPCVIFASDGEGLGKDAVVVSFHRSYSDYADFMREFTVDWADFVIDLQSFLVSVKKGVIMKPFDLKYFADDKGTKE
ncbi:MAG: Lrp/AsnC family transcriptional regulator [Candidatus Bathyarchaeia archaeon]|nr:Lrp/AsnC family transcriptional regulator [Candidatus Bathyarchaeota archaeon A05DMB-4]MDH7594962.1 Lrp/AsnC family transcriptional regulator [Candidatus Bathyarchaeota archaeon]